MTRYTVIWDEEVESAFINYWSASDSITRMMLTEAANWIDSNLAENPEAKGQARPDLPARIIAVPLSMFTTRVAATYEVWPNDRLVRVLLLTVRKE
jgi:hypothetical protein